MTTQPTPQKKLKPDGKGGVNLYDSSRTNEFNEMWCVAPNIQYEEVEDEWASYLQHLNKFVAKLDRTQTVEMDTFQEAVVACRAYLDNHLITAEDWGGGKITHNGEFLAHVSYNGRCWPVMPKDWTAETPYYYRTCDCGLPMFWNDKGQLPTECPACKTKREAEQAQAKQTA